MDTDTSIHIKLMCKNQNSETTVTSIRMSKAETSNYSKEDAHVAIFLVGWNSSFFKKLHLHVRVTFNIQSIRAKVVDWCHFCVMIITMQGRTSKQNNYCAGSNCSTAVTCIFFLYKEFACFSPE